MNPWSTDHYHLSILHLLCDGHRTAAVDASANEVLHRSHAQPAIGNSRRDHNCPCLQVAPIGVHNVRPAVFADAKAVCGGASEERSTKAGCLLGSPLR